MNLAQEAPGLAFFISAACLAGTLFMAFRLYCSLSESRIWLHGQRVGRAEDPFWFWTYVAIYGGIIAGLLYGMLVPWRP